MSKIHRFGDYDRAILEQVQARAVDAIRAGHSWFLYVVDAESFVGEHFTIAPASPGNVNTRVLLKHAAAAILETLEGLDP